MTMEYNNPNQPWFPPGDTLLTRNIAGGPGAVITSKQQSMNAINN